MISGKAVFGAIDAETAIERTREAFERYGRGEWTMPAKVYLDSSAARRLPGDAGAAATGSHCSSG